MKSIETNAIINSIRAKVDGSLGLGVSTPELTPEEKVVFMSLQNLNIKLTIEPDDIEEKIKVEKGMDTKSESKRLMDIIFVYYKQVKSTEDFNAFYKRHMEGLIDRYKEKLN